MVIVQVLVTRALAFVLYARCTTQLRFAPALTAGVFESKGMTLTRT